MPTSNHRLFPYQTASGGSAAGCRLCLQAKRDALLRHLRAAADDDELQQQRERVLVRMIVQNFGIGLPMQLGACNQKSTGSVCDSLKKSQKTEMMKSEWGLETGNQF